MTGKRYSAGAIYLQVEPVFRNFQREIERETERLDKDLSDRMEAAGDRAGRRAGRAVGRRMREGVREDTSRITADMERDLNEAVRSMEKSLGRLDQSRFGKRIRKDIAEMKAELSSIRDVDIKVDDNLAQVTARVAAVRAAMAGLQKRSQVFLRMQNLPQVYRELRGVEDRLKRIDGTIRADLDTDRVVRKFSLFEKRFRASVKRAADSLSGEVGPELDDIRAELNHLLDLRVGVDIDSDQAIRDLQIVRQKLQSLSRDRSQPRIDLEGAGQALATLVAFEAATERLDGKDIEIDVKTDKARLGFGRFNTAADRSANSFRSFNAIALLLASYGPALVPILGGIAGGLLAIGPAAAVAGAGIGTVLVGFSGLSDAVTALQGQQDDLVESTKSAALQQRASAYAIRDAQDALANAVRAGARAEVDAAQTVRDARESAARAVEQALKRQTDAQKRYRDSVQDVRDAEADLRQARKDAAETGANLDRAIRRNKLDLSQALLDSFGATTNYNAVQADGSSTNADKEQARIQRESALLRIDTLRAEQKQLAAEKREWDKSGVDGTDRVRSAEERLQDAVEAQRDAYRKVGEAAEAVDDAREQGAERVSRALRDQNRVLEDNERAIGRATESLRRAREAALDVADATSAQDRAVEDAMSKLGPAGQAFARFLFDARAGFYAFRDDVQQVLLPSVQVALEAFFGSGNADKARNALIALAENFGELAKLLSTSLQGSAWGEFFSMLGDLGPEIQQAWGEAFILLLEAMASMLTTLAPFALDFAEAIRDIMAAFAGWAASEEGQAGLSSFMQYAKDIGPDVLAFIVAFSRAATALVKAFAPWGDVVLQSLTGMLDIIAQMDPSVLMAFAVGLTVMIGAAQNAFALLNVLKALGALSGPVGLVILIVGVLIALFAALYTKNEEFRAFVQEAWAEISAALTEAWEDHLKPALDGLFDAFEELWKDVLQPFFAWFGPLLVEWYKIQLPLLAKAFALLVRGVTLAIKYVIVPLFKALGRAAVWLWENAMRPALKKSGDAWEAFSDVIDWVRNKVIKPAFDWITDKALPKLKNAFTTVVDKISEVWEGLKKAFAAPIRFVIDKVINKGLIKGFNTVAKWVGSDYSLTPLTMPTSLQFARGGVMPGHTPGRDVHRFFSPTGGLLDLSGGEAVMRPEWTDVMGREYVDRMNALARRHGAAGVRRAMRLGGFFNGGIMPVPGGYARRHGSEYSFPAYDINAVNDYGLPVKAWKPGRVAQVRTAYSNGRLVSYGRWVVLNHPGGESSLYAHLSRFGQYGVGDQVAGGATIGYVGSAGNSTGSHLHFEIRNALASFYGDAKERARSLPGSILEILKDPLGAFGRWITDPLKQAGKSLAESPVMNIMAAAPAKLAKATVDKVWDIVPGWAKNAAGWVGNAAKWVIGGIKNLSSGDGNGRTDFVSAPTSRTAEDYVSQKYIGGYADGGVLPYNGTMAYDSGGYLPPGLTSVVNLTGKPEPVFTDDQFARMNTGRGVGLTQHYEPHFEGSDLTAEDVAQDLNAAFRKLARSGKYGGTGS